MSQAPVPYMDWRTAAADGTIGACPVKKGDTVIVGLGSSVKVSNASKMLIFGGERTGPDRTIHACPGYGMAVGVMLGCITALLTAGALRPTPDPRVLVLIR
jgi:cytochrome P450